MDDYEERKQQFIDIHKNARLAVGQSQEYMALELNVSKKTVQNWERGVSMPSFFESLEWFRALRINPFPLYMSIIKPHKLYDASPQMSDKEVDEALSEVMKCISPECKRALLYLFMGKHGSPFYSVLQLMLAHLHLPLQDRLYDAMSVLFKYEMVHKRGDLICKENILPDTENLHMAIEEAQESSLRMEFSYDVKNKRKD